eukprot:SM000269S09893  [mRNA]  locus=s269:133231:137435:+ [translate_table: standard]
MASFAASLAPPTRLAAVAAPGDCPWSLGDELLSSDTEKTEDNWLYTPPRLAVAAGRVVAAPVRQREQRASEPTPPTRIPSPRRRASAAALPARPSLPAQRPKSPARPALERRNSTGSAAARPGPASGSKAASSSAGLAVRRADPASTAYPSAIASSGSRPQQAAAPRSSSAGRAVRGRATLPATTAAAVTGAARLGPPALRSQSLPRSRSPAANGGSSPLSARPTSLFSRAAPAAEALAGGPALATARPPGATLLLADERTPPNLRTSLSERGAGGSRVTTPAVAHLQSSASSTTPPPPPSSAFNSSSSRALRFHEVASKPRWQAGGNGSPAAAPAAVARSSGPGGSTAASPSLREYSGGPASRPRLGLEAPLAPPPPLSELAPLPMPVLTSPSVGPSSAAAPHGRRVSFHDDQDGAGASGTRLSPESTAELEALPPLPLLPALSPLLRGSAAMTSKRPRWWRSPPAHLGGLFPGREEYYGEQPAAAAANFGKAAGSSDDDYDDDEEEGGDDDGSWGGGDATEIGSSAGEGGALADVEGDSDYAAAGRNDSRGSSSGARTSGGGGEGGGLHGCTHSRNSSGELYMTTSSPTIGAAERALVAAIVGISGASCATKVAPCHDHDGVIGGDLEAGDIERQHVEATAAAAASKCAAGSATQAGLPNMAASLGAAASAQANSMACHEAASRRAEIPAMMTSMDLTPLVVCEMSPEAAADTAAAAPLAAAIKAAATSELLPVEGCVGSHRQVAAGEDRGPAPLPVTVAALLEEDEQALYGDLVGGVRAQIDGWKEEDSSLLHEMELGSTAAAAALWDVAGNGGGGGPAEGREGDSGNRGPPVVAPTTPSSFGSAAPSLAEADGGPLMVQAAVSESSSESGRKANAVTATASSAEEPRSLPEPQQQPLPRAVMSMPRSRPRGLAEGQAPQPPPHSSLNASMSDSRTMTTAGSSAKSTSSEVNEWDHSSSIADEVCSEVSTSSTMLSRHTTLEEATNTILFCSSIVHDIVFKAALIAEANGEEAGKRLEEAKAAQAALPWAPSPVLKAGGVAAATERKVPLQPGCTCRIL